MDGAQIKDEIRALVDKYEKAKASGQIKKYSEEDTKKDFIQPLFEILGWNTSDRNEVSSEERIKSAGRVDYGFYIDEHPKFFLEAKPLTADLNKEEFAHQAIKYSWNKGVTWAILTDFESIKVFNAEAVSKYLGDKLVFEIPYNEYLSRFDQLWQLSRDGFEKNSLDTYAEQIGKKLQKVPVSDLLYKDLNECRNILLNTLKQWNSEKNISNELLEEGVQKLLGRLIFIRVLEDRGIEDNTLHPLIRAWETSKKKNEVTIYQSMIKKFRELDDVYNSNLFQRHPFESWEEHSGATKKVIETLYGKKGYYEYDFKAMPADVLGNVYENYLGRILSQSKKGIEITAAPKKRKEQGIYYTPSFIVDYIVENALKPVLDKCNSVADLKEIKVLDPACGSGSFLIKANEVIYDKYIELGAPANEFTKLLVLTENIYGVDLDDQAVEIARLNLLINALDSKMKLPSLSDNIKNGNSLISGTDEELENYFGKDFRDKKPFNWQEQFPEVFNQGGFAVVIGNPPYVQLSMEKDTDDNLKSYLITRFKSSMGRLNTFGFFTKLGIDLLKEDGYLGFIIPNTILTQEYYQELRKIILENCYIKNIVLLEELPFKQAVVENVILILNKNTGVKVDNSKIEMSSVNEQLQVVEKGNIPQQAFNHSLGNAFVIDLNTESNNLKQVICKQTILLGGVMNINQGIALKHERSKYLSKENKDKEYKPVLDGRNINKYQIKWDGDYLKYDISAIHSSKNESIFLKEEKILFRRVGDELIAAYDNSKFYALNTLVVMYFKEKSGYSLKYFLGLFNSKLLNYYYKTFLKSKKKVFSEIQARQVSQLPIRMIDFDKPNDAKSHSLIAGLAGKITKQKEELIVIQEASNKWNSIKAEIERLDRKIDEEVYRLYGLTLEEIAIVEGNY